MLRSNLYVFIFPNTETMYNVYIHLSKALIKTITTEAASLLGVILIFHNNFSYILSFAKDKKRYYELQFILAEFYRKVFASSAILVLKQYSRYILSTIRKN